MVTLMYICGSSQCGSADKVEAVWPTSLIMFVQLVRIYVRTCVQSALLENC